jgi:hypothetical protein
MFIVSTKKFRIRRPERPVYDIPKGFVGDIPEDVAEQWIIQAAIKDGSIVCSQSHTDKAVETAVSEGKAKVKKAAKAKEEK